MSKPTQKVRHRREWVEQRAHKDTREGAKSAEEAHDGREARGNEVEQNGQTGGDACHPKSQVEIPSTQPNKEAQRK